MPTELAQLADRYVHAEHRLRRAAAAAHQIPASSLLALKAQPGGYDLCSVFVTGHAERWLRGNLAGWVVREAMQPSTWQQQFLAVVGAMHQDDARAALADVVELLITGNVDEAEVDFDDALALAWLLRSRVDVCRLLEALHARPEDDEARDMACDFEERHTIADLPPTREQLSNGPAKALTAMAPQQPSRQDELLWNEWKAAYGPWREAVVQIKATDPMSTFQELRTRASHDIQTAYLTRAFGRFKQPDLLQALATIDAVEVEQYAVSFLALAKRDAGTTAHILRVVPAALEGVGRADLGRTLKTQGAGECGTFDSADWLITPRSA